MFKLILSWVLGRMVSTRHNDELVKEKVRYQKRLDGIADEVNRDLEAMGAVLFVAGQQLAVLQDVREALVKAQKGVE